MSVLTSKLILEHINKTPPLISGFLDLDLQLQTNGFDLSLRSVSKLVSFGRLSMDNKNRVISSQITLQFEENGMIHLEHGCYSIVFNEIVNLPKNIMAIGMPRSSLLRCGSTIHTAVWDAGYCGRSESLLVVNNPLGQVLEKDARVLQLVFSFLTSQSEGYSGIYQGENIS